MDRLLVSALVGFGLTVGVMALVWYARRRSISQVDDPSILLAAPPDGMTPAVATVINREPVRTAFIAALIDLASRGEISFVDEGRLETGIQIGGADLKDARIELNRRAPAGEAETWLLGELRLRAGNPDHAPWDSNLDGANLPFISETGEAMLASVLRAASENPEDEASAAAKQTREQGLLSTTRLDPALVEQVYEVKTGHPMSAKAQQAWSEMTAHSAQIQAADMTATDSGSAVAARASRLYIPAQEASTMTNPFMFGTFLETYARRHGWLGAMPFVTRLRWRLFGVVAAGIGVVLLSVGTNSYSDTWTGLGMGLFLGGIVVTWRAPAMVQPTKTGGLVRAQLAAYRRTLDATFKSAGSINDAVGPSGLRWLSTPDQAIAWAVALGLPDAVRNLLSRNVSTAEAPVSLGRSQHPGAKLPDSNIPTANAAQMFDAIQNIGRSIEQVPSYLRPIRGWLKRVTG